MNHLKMSSNRVTAAQTDLLCTFFEDNPEVIRGYKKHANCVEAVMSKWRKVSDQLNSLGPAKPHKEWSKYLCNLKAKMKRKRIKWRQNSDGSGPIICNTEDFNKVELRMLLVLRKESLSQDTLDSSTSDFNMDDNDNSNNDQDDESCLNDAFPSMPMNESTDGLKYINKPDTTSFQNVLPMIETKLQPPHVIDHENEFNDEFFTFGRNIAQQLKTMPLDVALETQEMLLSVMRKQRLKSLNYSACNIDPLDKPIL